MLSLYLCRHRTLRLILTIAIRFLLVVLLLNAAGLAAYHQFGTTWLRAALEANLRTAGWQLDELQFSPALRLPIRVEKLTVSSATISLALSDIRVLPRSGWRYEISIADVDLQYRTGNGDNLPGKVHDEAPQTPRELLGLLKWLPAAGDIRHFSVCLPSCFDGQLHWRGGSGAISLLQPRQTFLSFTINDSAIDLSGTLRGNPAGIGNVTLIAGTEAVRLRGEALVISDSLPVQIESPIAAAVDFRVAAMGFELDFPLDTPLEPEAALAALRGHIDVESSQRWSARVDGIGIESGHTINASVSFTDTGPRLASNAPLAINITAPGIEAAQLLIDAGSQCDLGRTSVTNNNELYNQLRCGLVNVTLNGALEDSGMLIDANLTGLHLSYDLTGPPTAGTAAARFNVRLHEDDMILGSIAGAVSFVDGRVEASTDTASILGIDVVRLRLNHQVSSAAGSLDADVSVPMAQLEHLMGDLEVSHVTFENGHAKASGIASWTRDHLDLSFELQAGMSASIDAFSLGDGQLDARASVTGIPIAPLRRLAFTEVAADGSIALDLRDGPDVIAATMGTVEVREGRLRASMDNTTILGVPGIGLQAHYDIETRIGSVAASGTLALKELPPLIPEYIPDGAEFTRGTVSGDASVAWAPEQFDINGRLQATHVGMTWDGYVIDGANLAVDGAGWPVLVAKASTLEVDRINIGIPIERIRATFDLQMDTNTGTLDLRGHEFAARIFGGDAQSQDFRYAVPAGDGHMQLALSDIQLEYVLALQQETVTGTGVLAGSVPIQVRGDTVSIKAGTLHAVQGGSIRYQPDDGVAAGVAANSEMKMLIAALSDFHYHGLSAGLTYDESGLMNTDIALKGRNPGFQNGREVHLNLTLQENIATLLESLRIGDTITDEIRRKQGNRK